VISQGKKVASEEEEDIYLAEKQQWYMW